MEAWAGDFELDPSSREGLSGPNSNQIGTGRSARRRQTLVVDASLPQRLHYYSDAVGSRSFAYSEAIQHIRHQHPIDTRTSDG
jgi:hypothetical protein